jgi:hypothetical protein
MGGKNSKNARYGPTAPYGYGPRRAPQNIPPYFPSGAGYPGYGYGSSYGAPTYSYPGTYGAANSALALDAADGVIDGRYFGSPIAGRSAYPALGAPSVIAPPVIPSVTRAMVAPATIASPFSTYSPAVYSSPYASSSALALDAADGVIDGRYFGSPIAGGAPLATSFAAPYATSFAPSFAAPAPVFSSAIASPFASSSALALDAADGVIDGRYFGSPIAGRSAFPASFAAPAFAPTFAPSFAAPAYATSFAPSVVAPSFSPFGGASSALALDAADGVIDGRFFGSPIAGGVSSFAAPSFASPFTTSYAAPMVSPFGASAFGASPFGSSALALDAADGVIDGRFFGSPIASAPVYGGASIVAPSPVIL